MKPFVLTQAGGHPVIDSHNLLIERKTNSRGCIALLLYDVHGKLPRDVVEAFQLLPSPSNSSSLSLMWLFLLLI